MSPIPEFETCYRAVASRDERFDGWFVTAVTSTHIYCRPSCPAMTPQRRNVRFYPSAAAAQRSGFRACLRCRPDAAPGSPDWDVRADVVGRAMRLIADGEIDRGGVPGLASRLGYTERHLHRMLTTEVGAGPLALARAQRAQTARILIETTDLGLAEIAFAAGFGSVRQFNDTVREIFAHTPSGLRTAAARRRRGNRPAETGTGWTTITLRLAYRPPLDAPVLLEFLAARALPGVEEVADGAYRRALRLPHGFGVAAIRPLPEHVEATLRLADLRDLGPAVARCRRLFDLDADPTAVDAVLAADPALAAEVAKHPGVRLPRTVDGFEMVCRAIVGQQISVAAVRTVLSRLAIAAGDALPAADGTLTHTFPSAEAVAGAPDELLPMPAARRTSLRTVAAMVAAGDLPLDGGADRSEVTAALLAVPGVGPWTADYVALRALGDPDVFLPTDLGVRKGAAALGIPDRPADLSDRAQAWRPWRSYAVIRLWRHAAARISTNGG